MSIKDAGFLPVPNGKIFPRLREIGTAFCGATFFTFTAGAGLSLVSLAGAMVWRAFHRRKSVLVFFILVWAGVLFAASTDGFSPLVFAYFLFIPPLVFIVAGRGTPPPQDKRAWIRGAVFFMPILILPLLWTTQVTDDLFTELRDRLLLSNRAGTWLNDFYYKYNLYGAEVFKTLDQKMLKTCNLRLQPKRSSEAVEWELVDHDYLNTGDAEPDLSVEEESADLVLKNRGKEVLRTDYKAFMSNPGGMLKDFSRRTDRHAFFRVFVFLGLLTFPLAIYVFLHGLISSLLSFFMNRDASSFVATALCFCAGLFLFFVFYMGKEGEMKSGMVADALGASRWQTRVAALKVAEKEKLEVKDFREYPSLLHSPVVAERYWLARALAVSQRFDTLIDLRSLLADPSPNVVTQALYALGERKNRLVIQEIVRFMGESDHWYCQWYAYKALRKLGWKQGKSRG